MFTDWADEVIRKVFAHIFIAAYTASPDCFTLGSSANSFRLWFNVVLVKLVGAGRGSGKNCHELRLADK